MVERRRTCPLACALDLFGDRWTLVLADQLMSGPSRFKDFVARADGIPTNILTERLNRLVETGIVEKVPVAEGSRRQAYRLTEKGTALRPVLASIRRWQRDWDKAPEAPPEPVPPAGPFFEEPEHFADLGCASWIF
jgi:DNA-binding HxlR family transcriptional regulator